MEFCVTMDDGAVRYRQLRAPHALGTDAPSDRSASSIGVGYATECAEEGQETSASNVLAELDRIHRRREIAPWVPLMGVFVVYLAAIGALGLDAPTPVVVVVVVLAVGAVAGAFVLVRRFDRARGTTHLVYHLDPVAVARYVRLQKGIRRLASCKRVWHVPTEGRPAEGRFKYNARLFLRRYRIRPGLAPPPRVESNVRVPTIYGEHRKFFFLPDRVLVYDERGVVSLAYAGLGMHTGERLCVEDEDVPSDARVVDSTWLYAKPDGAPDPAFANNRRYPVVLYGELEFAGPGGVRELFLFSQPEAAADLLEAVERVAWGEDDDYDEETEQEPDATEAEPEVEEAAGSTADEAYDELYEDALRVVVRAGFASLDLLTKEFGIDYGRAAMIVSVMEQEGYVGPTLRNKPRVVNRSAVRYVEVRYAANGSGDDTRRKQTSGEHGSSRRRSTRRGPRHGNGGPKRPAHEVLGVKPNATREDVTAAYHELAQLYHPDKVASLAEEFRELAELRMKEINVAYRSMIKGG